MLVALLFVVVVELEMIVVVEICLNEGSNLLIPATAKIDANLVEFITLNVNTNVFKEAHVF